MFENLRKLYKHYGGIKSVVSSGYLWVAIILSILSYKSVFNFSWTAIALSVMPSLAGFTIASFAIIIAILEPKMFRTLMSFDKDGQSPITSIVSVIGHAVFIQVTAMILAISFKIISLYDFIEIAANKMHAVEASQNIMIVVANYIKWVASATGLLFTYYGVLLVLAAILSIVRMQLIVAGVSGQKPPSTK